MLFPRRLTLALLCAPAFGIAMSHAAPSQSVPPLSVPPLSSLAYPVLLRLSGGDRRGARRGQVGDHNHKRAAPCVILELVSMKTMAFLSVNVQLLLPPTSLPSTFPSLSRRRAHLCLAAFSEFQACLRPPAPRGGVHHELL